MSENFKFEKLPGEPIGIFTALPGYDMSVDVVAGTAAAFEFLDAQDEPIYYIHDFLVVDFPDVEDVSVGAMTVALSENPLFKHPNIREIIFVTTNMLFSLAAKGLDSNLYGNIKSRTFATMEEALSYARSGG